MRRLRRKTSGDVTFDYAPRMTGNEAKSNSISTCLQSRNPQIIKKRDKDVTQYPATSQQSNITQYIP